MVQQNQLPRYFTSACLLLHLRGPLQKCRRHSALNSDADVPVIAHKHARTMVNKFIRSVGRGLEAKSWVDSMCAWLHAYIYGNLE